jgi:hypothetical protein
VSNELSDDQISRGAVIALSDLRRHTPDQALYGAYRAAAVAWVNEAQERLSVTGREVTTERVCACGHLRRNHLIRMTGECIYRDANAFPCWCTGFNPATVGVTGEAEQ